MALLWFVLGATSGMLVVVVAWVGDGLRVRRRKLREAAAREDRSRVNVVGRVVFPEVLDPRWKKLVKIGGSEYQLGPIRVVFGSAGLDGVYVDDGARKHKISGVAVDRYCRAVHEAEAERAAAGIPEFVQRVLEEA